MAYNYLYGSNGSDTIDAAYGVTNDPDYIVARDGDDTIFGLGGGDVIIGGRGADYINGGPGADVAIYSTSDAGVYVSLWQGFGMGGDAQGDTLVSIEHLDGSDFPDTLGGDDNGNLLRGLDGNDTLKGWGGDDVLEGMAGNDVLEGGARSDRSGGDRLESGDRLDGGTGVDTASYDMSTEGVFVDLESSTGQGGDAAGDFYVSIENVIGSHHDDVLAGHDADNVLNGQQGHDILKGGGGTDALWGGGDDDELLGENGVDTLHGGFGSDTVYGGYGFDILYGDADADTFVWHATGETSVSTVLADRIKDFNAAEGDLIAVSGIDANVYAGGNQAFTFIGDAAFSGTPGELRYYHSFGNTYIEMQTGTSADVEGVIRLTGIATPEASWFVL
jgi:Ca2+-binding RTX toxin-like protein